MNFLFISIVVVGLAILLFKKQNSQHPFFLGCWIGIALAVVATVSLGQNYTQSLIPEANDGIGISNTVAYWIIGEEHWSVDQFKRAFERSMYFTLILIILSPLVYFLESKRTNVKTVSNE